MGSEDAESLGPAGGTLTIASILVVAYFSGIIGTTLSFRLLDAIGELVDAATTRLGGPANSLVRFLSARFGILSLRTMQQEVAGRLAESDVRQLPVSGLDSASHRWAIYKFYVLHHSEALGKQLLDREAEINFFGGMSVPAIIAGVLLLPVHPTAAWVLIIIGVYLVLRFQICAMKRSRM